MKNNVYKNIWGLCLLFSFAFSALIFTSCDDDNDDSGSTPAINNVYLEDAQSTVPDRLVEFIRLGQTIRLEGSGFAGVKKIYVNGHSVYFNPVFMTDNNIIFRVSSSVPVMDASDDVRNTIRLEKSETNSFTYSFEIRSAAPSITGISHTMPQAGEKIIITGTALQEIKSITFPGNVVVTEGIVEDEDGRWVEVIVPAGVSNEGGSILVIGANGGAYSPAYFNFKKGLLHNFDDVNNAAWSNGEISDDLTAVMPSAAGSFPKSQGVYRSANKSGKTMSAGDAPVDYTRYWIDNSVWAGVIAESGIPLSTTTDQCAIQMDIYYEGVWNSGNIRFVIADGWGADRYCVVYAPWTENGLKVEVANPGCWHTITLPFNLSKDFEKGDLAAVLEQISLATYKQAGPWFENGNIDEAQSEASDLNIYFDNIRIVPLEVPAYSDFNDEEEE